MTDDDPTYSLALSDQEVERYRFMAQMARVTEAAHWDQAGIVAGATIADIGCGPGLVLAELADVVGPGGQVLGVDREADAVDTARHLLDEAGATNVTVTRADAWATGIEPGSIDVVNIRHVLAHNTEANRRRIVSHAFDLLAPGGSMYLVDADLTGARMDPHDADVRDLMDRYCEHLRDTGRDAELGPTLGSLAESEGFTGVERHATFNRPPAAAFAATRPPAWAARGAMIASGHATATDVERWDRALTGFAETGLAVFIPIYSVIARRPV